MKKLEEIKDLAKKHFFEGQNEKELAIARIGFVEGYKQAQPKWVDVEVCGKPKQWCESYFYEPLRRKVYEGFFDVKYGFYYTYNREEYYVYHVSHYLIKELPSPPQQ